VVPRATLADARLAVSACRGDGREASGGKSGQSSSARNWIVTKASFVVGLAMLAGATRVFAQDDQARFALDNLVAAYPSALAGHDGRVLRWRDGIAMPVSDGADSKTLAEFLRTLPSSISFASRIRAARSKNRRPSMPIRAGSAIPRSSRRCMATAKRARCRRTLFPSPGFPRPWQ